ncbi:MAG: hypothetical protein R3321_02930 [Nitrososphaeraceae archaeon]|nr:hypothetical protein [Nitrososphaeraceae archaeon]
MSTEEKIKQKKEQIKKEYDRYSELKYALPIDVMADISLDFLKYKVESFRINMIKLKSLAEQYRVLDSL